MESLPLTSDSRKTAMRKSQGKLTDLQNQTKYTNQTGKCHNTAPMYLSRLVKKKSSLTNTRLTNDDLLLVISPLKRNCSNTFFEISLNFAALTEWNRLDKRIRRISNLNTFKSEIKTILFLNYFDV